jgi:hypothetical protein
MITHIQLRTLAVLATLSASAAWAKGGDEPTIWQGQGEEFGADGQASGQYALQQVDTTVDDGVTESAVTITPASGDEIHFTMRISSTGNRFSIKSDYAGTGGGYCFGEGVCQGLVTLPNGHDMALTIIADRPGARRFLGTELVNGQAVRFIRESYSRVDASAPI